MHTLLNYTNPTPYHTENDSDGVEFTHSSSSWTSLDNLSSIVLILILSILCFFGVIFMIFGPMMRSEAWKRVDNYIFGQDVEHTNREDGGDGTENGDA